jgi:hypothetical protein
MSNIKKTGVGTTPPTVTSPQQPATEEAQKTPEKAALGDRVTLPADEAVQKWFLQKGRNTASIQGQIRKGLENLLNTYYSVKGTGAMALQTQEMLARSGQIAGVGVDATRKKRLARWLKKKAKLISAEFGLSEDDAEEFVAMLAVSLGAPADIVYGE